MTLVATNVLKKATPEKISAYNKAYKKANPEKISAYNKAYKKANSEKISAYNKTYRKANLEKIANYSKAYKKANLEKISAYNKAYRKANLEKIADYNKAYYAANKGTMNACAKKYKLAKLKQIPKWVTKEELIYISNLYREAQLRTKVTGFNWDVDHIIPLSKGGRHCLTNLQIVPASWNRSKGNRNELRFIYATKEKEHGYRNCK